jgi:hypothetical protein
MKPSSAGGFDDGADRRVRIGLGKDVAHVIKGNTMRCRRDRIDLHSDCEFLRTVHQNLRYSWQL